MKTIIFVSIILLIIGCSCSLFEFVDIQITIDGKGSVITIPKESAVLKNDIVTLTATSISDRWSFIKWVGDIESEDNPLTIRVDKDIEITAVFVENIAIDFTSNGPGKVLYSPIKTTYPLGSIVHCLAIPEDGYFFSHWNDNSKDISAQFTVSKDQEEICAFFEEKLYYSLNAKWNTFTQSNLELPLYASPFSGTTNFSEMKLPKIKSVRDSRYIYSQESDALIVKLLNINEIDSFTAEIEMLEGVIETEFLIYNNSYIRVSFLGKTENEMLDIIAHISLFPEVEYVEIDQTLRAHAIPNDKFYSFQWNFHQLGLPVVWDKFYNLPYDVIVAVLDTGVDFFLSDFNKTQFTSGYDFINNDPHPFDDNGHGSHVIGTIAQSTNNSEGVAGFAYLSKIMPIKVLNSNGSGTSSQIAQGIVWAVNNGADVINMSLGASSLSQTIYDACKFAFDHGVLIIASSGNDNGPVGYPAAIDEYVYAVGSSDNEQERAYYSNYGPELDIVAPGGNLSKTIYNTTFDIDYPAGILQQTQGDYYFYQGTSMAAPHVSALASLLLKKNPTLTPNQIMNRISESADDLGISGKDNYFGWGLINPLQALNISSKYIHDSLMHSIIPRDGIIHYWKLNAAKGPIEIVITYDSTDTTLQTTLLNSIGELISTINKVEDGYVRLQTELLDNDTCYLKIEYASL